MVQQVKLESTVLWAYGMLRRGPRHQLRVSEKKRGQGKNVRSPATFERVLWIATGRKGMNFSLATAPELYAWINAVVKGELERDWD